MLYPQGAGSTPTTMMPFGVVTSKLCMVLGANGVALKVFFGAQ